MMEAQKHYAVNEIFYSLQGEGWYTGTPAVFLRFSRCNRACPFCDTDFASFTLMTAPRLPTPWPLSPRDTWCAPAESPCSSSTATCSAC